MVDIENIVYTKIANAVHEEYPDAEFYGMENSIPSKFPAINIYESANETYKRSITTDKAENHASVVFDVNIYTNDISGRKTEAKKIASIIDSEMLGMRFRRSSKMYDAPNESKAIYRIILRYQGLVDTGTSVGNDTIYRIYNN